MNKREHQALAIEMRTKPFIRFMVRIVVDGIIHERRYSTDMIGPNQSPVDVVDYAAEWMRDVVRPPRRRPGAGVFPSSAS